MIKMEENFFHRSQLYSLEPAGYGAWIESGASYIARLALEHSITTESLISEIILPLIGEDSKYINQNKYSSVAYLVNGIGPFAQKWISALKVLTGVLFSVQM